jgi:transcription elongation factor Elf1
LVCPECGEQDAALRIDLNDLKAEVTCSNCDMGQTVDQIIERLTEQLDRWQGVSQWIETAKQFVYGQES